MARFTCTECGVVLPSSDEAAEHRLRTHPDENDLIAMSKEIGDYWTMIQTCLIDRQWLFVSMTLDQFMKELKRLRSAAERMLLR